MIFPLAPHVLLSFLVALSPRAEEGQPAPVLVHAAASVDQKVTQELQDLERFFRQLSDSYKNQTADQGAAKIAGLAAIEEFALLFCHHRDQPDRFENWLTGAAEKARIAGSQDPLLRVCRYAACDLAQHPSIEIYEILLHEQLQQAQDAVDLQYGEASLAAVFSHFVSFHGAFTMSDLPYYVPDGGMDPDQFFRVLPIYLSTRHDALQDLGMAELWQWSLGFTDVHVFAHHFSIFAKFNRLSWPKLLGKRPLTQLLEAQQCFNAAAEIIAQKQRGQPANMEERRKHLASALVHLHGSSNSYCRFLELYAHLNLGQISYEEMLAAIAPYAILQDFPMRMQTLRCLYDHTSRLPPAVERMNLLLPYLQKALAQREWRSAMHWLDIIGCNSGECLRLFNIELGRNLDQMMSTAGLAPSEKSRLLALKLLISDEEQIAAWCRSSEWTQLSPGDHFEIRQKLGVNWQSEWAWSEALKQDLIREELLAIGKEDLNSQEEWKRACSLLTQALRQDNLPPLVEQYLRHRLWRYRSAWDLSQGASFGLPLESQAWEMNSRNLHDSFLVARTDSMACLNLPPASIESGIELSGVMEVSPSASAAALGILGDEQDSFIAGQVLGLNRHAQAAEMHLMQRTGKHGQRKLHAPLPDLTAGTHPFRLLISKFRCEFYLDERLLFSGDVILGQQPKLVLALLSPSTILIPKARHVGKNLDDAFGFGLKNLRIQAWRPADISDQALNAASIAAWEKSRPEDLSGLLQQLEAQLKLTPAAACQWSDFSPAMQKKLAACQGPEAAMKWIQGQLKRELKVIPARDKNWIASANSEESDTPASFAIDGKPDSIWHSLWRSPGPRPAQLTLDLQTPQNLGGLRLQRRGKIFNGTPAWIEINTSDDGIHWTCRCSSPAWTVADPQAAQSLDFFFPENLSSRWVKITCLGTAGPFRDIGSLAEVSLLTPP